MIRTVSRNRFKQLYVFSTTTPIKRRKTGIQIKKMSGQPEILDVQELKTEAKWLKLEKIHWKDQDGKERDWECANRTTKQPGGVDSVHILAILHHPSDPISTILIEQYRPPVGKTVVEFPAGLVDEGEDAETTALRELHEETGYGSGKADDGGNAKITQVSSVLVKDPGMTGANFQLVTVDIHLNESDPEPQQHLEEGEHIIKRVVPLKDLNATLQDYSKRGFAIDALVASVALGYQLRGSL
ncbi:putative phosphoribosyl-ATP diphosphatase [Naematelia encephala]|uniref:Putative phosphoribosyl-ATP diphosphatase n=1 Tax=Naematelia encephala TaxID=71784 RepID=A0A1Y2B1M0_9TREE|nr:putative phosphoribosyl-ATP diphosphatase [Naematelia encephala]